MIESNHQRTQNYEPFVLSLFRSGSVKLSLPQLCVLALAVLAIQSAQAQKVELPSGSAAILIDGQPLETLWEQGEFTEGVAVRSDGTVFFSDIAFAPDGLGRILTFSPETKKVAVFCEDSKKSNGLFFDSRNRLLACCGANGGLMSIVEVGPECQLKTLASKFDDKRFNSPNDLVIHPKGWVYFSDPRYVGDEEIELDHQSVYRLDSDGTVHRVTTNIEKPNGVHVSPDGKTLYVAETNNGSTDVTKTGVEVKRGRMTLNAFRIDDRGDLSEKRVIVNFKEKLGVDGMSIDSEGRIYAAVRSADRFGIVVFAADTGQELAYIPTPSLPTNCCFGVGRESSVLYVTAGQGLYRIRLKAHR